MANDCTTHLAEAASMNDDDDDNSSAMSMPFKYDRHFESTKDALVYLAEYDFNGNGFFDLALDITLPIDTPQADAGRNMLYLVICDAAALRHLNSLRTSGNGAGSVVSTAVPAYCAMANRTLEDYCLSYPLEDISTDANVYHVQETLSSELKDYNYINDSTLTFFIDACETMGGEESVLRSCLGEPGSLTNPDACFYCPKNYPSRLNSQDAVLNCPIPPAVASVLRISASMNLCDSNGQCLSNGDPVLSGIYIVVTIAWGISCIVWFTHLRSFARDTPIDLQEKMKFVPVTQFVAALAEIIAYHTDTKLVGTAKTAVRDLSTLTQLVALVIAAQMLIFIAKGWKITRSSLQPREQQWVRCVTLLWASALMLWQRSTTKHVTLLVILTIAWSAVVFMIWYNSAFNMNLLKQHVAMVRRMGGGGIIDVMRTPVYTKYMLFRRFRRMLGWYTVLSFVISILPLIFSNRNSSADDNEWQWVDTAGEEALKVLLFAAIGYTFRCRRFHRLIHVPLLLPSQAVITDTQSTSINVHASIAPEPTEEAHAKPSTEKQKTTIVVVLNPDHGQSLGMSYQPVYNPNRGSNNNTTTNNSPRKQKAPTQSTL